MILLTESVQAMAVVSSEIACRQHFRQLCCMAAVAAYFCHAVHHKADELKSHLFVFCDQQRSSFSKLFLLPIRLHSALTIRVLI